MAGRTKRPKDEREAMIAKCITYLHRAGSLPAARRLARREGFSAVTSDWITATGRVLNRKDPE